MQELASPWLHWFPQRFVQRTDSDRVLLAQFADTHAGDKHYGGIPIATIANALDEGSGAQLEALVRAEGFGEQPNPFDAQIVAEMKNGTSPDLGSPIRNAPPGSGDRGPLPRHRRDRRGEAKRRRALVPGCRARRVARAEACSTSGRSSPTDAQEKLSFVPAARRRREDRLAGDVRALPRRARQSSAGQEPIQRARARHVAARGEGPRHRADRRSGTTAHAAMARGIPHAGRQRRGDPRAAEVTHVASTVLTKRRSRKT